MKLEVRNDIQDQEYINEFLRIAAAIPVTIAKFIERKNVVIRLINYPEEIAPVERIGYYYQHHSLRYPIKGIVLDSKSCIAVCKDNTDINEIESILFHQIGHFIDAYEKFGSIKSFYDFSYSSKSEFINAYRDDLAENWNKISEIKDDINFEQLLQGSTPEKVVQTAVYELFAESFCALYRKSLIKDFNHYFKNTISLTAGYMKNLGL